MSCMEHNHNTSYLINFENVARQNCKAHATVFNSDFLKATVMCLGPCEDMGVEVHQNQDQLVTVVCGTATIKLGCRETSMNCTRKVSAGESLFIPAGMWHTIRNCGNGNLKMYSVYSQENLVNANARNYNSCQKEYGMREYEESVFDILRINGEDETCGCNKNSGC